MTRLELRPSLKDLSLAATDKCLILGIGGEQTRGQLKYAVDIPLHHSLQGSSPQLSQRRNRSDSSSSRPTSGPWPGRRASKATVDHGFAQHARRFFVHLGDKVVATINSSMNGTRKHGFSNITHGRFVSGTERAIRRAELLEPVRKGRFEPLLLQVPAIHLVALWLRNLKRDADLLMPISPVPKGVRAYRAVPTSKFVAKIARLASQKRREHEEFRRRGA